MGGVDDGCGGGLCVRGVRRVHCMGRRERCDDTAWQVVASPVDTVCVAWRGFVVGGRELFCNDKKKE